jgi:hypothetical protein
MFRPPAQKLFVPARVLWFVAAALLCSAPSLAQSSRRADKGEKALKPDPAEAPAPLMTPRGPTRIDFDDRLVQGQTNKLGAVYLYQRKTPAQPSLLARRQSFRAEITRDLLE